LDGEVCYPCTQDGKGKIKSLKQVNEKREAKAVDRDIKKETKELEKDEKHARKNEQKEEKKEKKRDANTRRMMVCVSVKRDMPAT